MTDVVDVTGDDSQDDSPGVPRNLKAEAKVSKWINEVTAAEKREKQWRKSAEEVICLYEADRKKEYQFNILYSNTETLAPALYSTTPRPEVERRFKDDDPVGGAASKVLERTLAYLMDDGTSVYASFDTLMIQSVVSGLVPGRGTIRFKYDAYISRTEKEYEEGEVQAEADRELPKEKEYDEKLESETVCGEFIPWDRFCHGYGRTWPEVPFVAYKWPMDRDELVKNFGAEIGNRVILASMSDQEVDGTKKSTDADIVKELKAAWVYEIWDKRTKTVIFISEGYKFGPLKEIEDPLGLTGFFDCPEPLKFFDRVSGLTPQTLYSFYEEQAKELNSITYRINRLIRALKVRGVYDASIDALSRLFEEDDNALLPADNVTAMYDRGGLERAIWLLPIDKIITVVQQLYLAREQAKQVIYEITGLSDILRGSSNPNETLGAQKIKDQWGNLRLRRQQKRVQRYCVDSMRIMAEIAGGKFEVETLAQMTNLKYPTGEEKQQAQALIAQMQAMAGQLQGQEPPPQALQAMQQAQAIVSQPSWDEIMPLLRSDIQRSYRIDIETNSTIEPEATEDRESMQDMLNALSQFLLGVQPLVADGSLPFEAMKSILLTICRRFSFGSNVEDELRRMQAPQNQGSDPEEAKKQQAEIQKQMQALEQEKANLELEKQKVEGQLQIAKAKQEGEIAQMFEQKKMELELEIKKAEMGIEMKRQEAAMQTQMQKSEASMQLKEEAQEIRAGLQEDAISQKEGMAQERAAKDADDKGKLEGLVQNANQQTSEAMQALTAAIQALTKMAGQGGKKTITSPKGEQYTVETDKGDDE